MEANLKISVEKIFFLNFISEKAVGRAHSIVLKYIPLKDNICFNELTVIFNYTTKKFMIVNSF